MSSSKKRGYLLAAPTLAVLIFLLFFPTGLSMTLSFTSWTPYRGDWWEAIYIGGANYVKLIQDVRFLASVFRTLLIVGVCLSIELGIGLGLALHLFRSVIRGRKIYILLLLVPMMMMPMVVGYNFASLFTAQGPVNQVLSVLSGVNVNVEYLMRPDTAMFVIILADIWQWTPFMFLVIYSGFVALPEEPIRAARVLGASEFRIFRRVMLPMLKPVLYVAILIRGLELFKLFDVPFIMTGGGPGTSTETLSMFMYTHGLTLMRISYVAAAATVIFFAVFYFTWFIIPRTPIMKKE